MADSILRLRVQSDEYDNKIKRAADGIQQYAQKCREAGGTLSFLDDGVLEFVQSLGQMDTVAKGSRQQMRELSNALTTLTTTYRGLTEEEKNSPFGVELARGIDALTERAGEARDAMSDVEQSIRNASSDTRTFDQLAQGMSVATAGFQGLTGAGKLLGIEMGNDVEVIAKLQAAMAVTNSLTTIQTALQKQSALMQGLNAAKTALATVSQQAYAVATGEATVAQTAFNVVASANPYALLLTAGGALIGVITAFAAVTRESTDEVKDAKKEMDTLTASVNEAAEAYERLGNKIKNLGIGGQKEYSMRRQTLTDQYDRLNERYGNLGYNMRYYEQRGETDSPIYQQMKEEHAKVKEEAEKIRKEIKKLDDANKERVDRLNQYKRLDFSDITSQSEAESAVSFLKEQIKYVDNTTSAYKQLKRAIEYAEKTVLPQFVDSDKPVKVAKQTVKKIKEEVKKEPIEVEIEPTGYITRFEQLKQNISIELGEQNIKIDENTLHTLMKDAIRKGIDGMDLDFASIQEQIGEGMDIPDEAWQKIIDKYNNFRKAIGEDPIEIDLTSGNESKGSDKPQKRTAGDGLEKFLKGDYAKVTSGVSSIASGIQQMGIEIPKEIQNVLGVVSGVTSILSGIATILTLIELNTQATAAATAADAIIPFANGGIVMAAGGTLVGNSFSGDNLRGIDQSGQIYGLNAGEVVLNRAQVGVLANELTGGVSSEGYSPSYVSGEQIYITLNRYLRRTGRGELMGWKKNK